VPEDIRGVVFRYSVREERIEMSGSAAA
jgi:hypothetical protein